MSPENDERTELGIRTEAGCDSRRNENTGRWGVNDLLVVESWWL